MLLERTRLCEFVIRTHNVMVSFEAEYFSYMLTCYYCYLQLVWQD